MNAFAYVASDAFPNSLDVRYKLFCLSFMGIATLQGGLLVLALNTAIVLGLTATLRIKPLTFLAQLKPFFFPPGPCLCLTVHHHPRTAGHGNRGE